LKTLVTFLATEVTCQVATARWQWGGFLLSSSLHCRECLSRQPVYLDSLYNPVPQGNWPHSVTYHLLHLNFEDCYVSGDGSGLVNQKVTIICLRFIWLQIMQGKSCW